MHTDIQKNMQKIIDKLVIVKHHHYQIQIDKDIQPLTDLINQLQ